jgi:hypothetical protein
MYQQHYEEFVRNHKIQKVQSYQADFETQMENYKKGMMNPALHNGMLTYKHNFRNLLLYIYIFFVIS